MSWIDILKLWESITQRLLVTLDQQTLVMLFIAAVLQFGFGCWVAYVQFQKKSLRLTCVFLFLVFSVLQMQAIRFGYSLEVSDLTTPPHADAETLLAIFERPPSNWTSKQRVFFNAMTGRHHSTVLYQLEEREDLKALIRNASAGCTGNDQEALRQAVLSSIQPQIISMCDQTLDATRQAVTALGEATDRSAGHIEVASQKVIAEWDQTAGNLVREVQGVDKTLTGLEGTLEDTKTSIEGVGISITQFRDQLMATPEAQREAGLLVRMDTDLNGVDSGVKSLSDFEEAIRDYRLCLAKRPWPFRWRCNARYPKSQPVLSSHEDEEALDIQRAAAEEVLSHGDSETSQIQTSRGPESPD